ncbi:MAG: hypothetical protein FJX46_01175 [Alphaproteobacteria bacterium]|nr:hypothetical protein [Alphaproteobacteria bacterium]
MTLRICVVGAGPAGIYAAEGLSKGPGAHIDVIDRLPTPFGLVRYGVAPDHQSTKAVTRVLERILTRPGIRFLGGIALGREVRLADLRQAYDAVVLATGCPQDRRLGIPGEDLPGVIGSGRFVAWYNGHPDFADLALPEGVRSVAVIGNGNVALDIARVLAKTPAEMAKSDLAPRAAAWIARQPLREIHVVGRRGPIEASFTTAELAEMGRLERAAALRDETPLPEAPVGDKVKEGNIAALRALVPRSADLNVIFRFNTTTELFVGKPEIEKLRVKHLGRNHDLPCDLVVTAIGYASPSTEGLELTRNGVLTNQDGRIADGLYVVGWAKRGPSGVIPTNRPESHAVAERILAEVQPSGRAGLDFTKASDWARWKRIEAAEIAAAAPGAPRRKLDDWAALAAIP